MDSNFRNTLTIAYLNIHGQSGLSVPKQKQIEDFLRNNDVDILHSQEINIEEDMFSQCHYLSSNYSIIQNNALNKYGTATFLKTEYQPENIKVDTMGRAIFFEILGITLGNVYLHSGISKITCQDQQEKTSVLRQFLNYCWIARTLGAGEEI